MSGASRIGGRHGPSGHGGGQDRSPSLVRFCRGRNVGDVVSGTFLCFESPTLGWASLEGEELLAHLPEEGPGPVLGQPVYFRVDSLVPEVVLRMLPVGHPTAGLSAVFPALPLARTAARYAASRDALEQMLDRDGPAQPEVVLERIAADPAALGAFAEACAHARAVTLAAGPELAFFGYFPWLRGEVRAVEMALWNREADPVTAGGRLVDGRWLTLVGRMTSGVLHYRLLLGDGATGGLKPGHTDRAVCMGVFQQRAGSRPAPDLLASILCGAAASGTAMGGYSRRV